MNEIVEKYLPLGTVVSLEGGSKKIMICGFCLFYEEDKNIYDYGGLVYPEGFVNFEDICLFNHEQIEQVYYNGYETEEEKQYKRELKDFINHTPDYLNIKDTSEDIIDMDDSISIIDDIDDDTVPSSLEITNQSDEEISIIDI